MDLDTFDRCCRHAKLMPHQRLMAEAYLYKQGGSMRQIAHAYGFPRMTVFRAVHKVMRAYRRIHEIPRVYPLVTIAAFPEHVEQLKAYERAVLTGRIEDAREDGLIRNPKPATRRRPRR